MNAHETMIAHAAASHIDLVNGQLPRDVQWMPPGRQVVKPMGFDEPFEMEITPAIATAADRQLQHLRAQAAAGADAEPYGDFNHKDEERSFKPVKFFWGGEDPKSGGVRMELAWTGAGAKAVKDGSQSCISPSWLLNKISKAFLGITHNVGGLVPRSAFHSIQAFAKAEAGNQPTENQPMDQKDKTEIGQMIADALKPLTEKVAGLAQAKAPDTTTANASATGDEIVKLFTESIEKAVKPLNDQLAEFKTNQENAVKAQAKNAVQAHIMRGAIAPEEKLPSGKLLVDYYTDAYIANAADADAAMSKLPGRTPRRLITQPANGGTSTATMSADPEERILAQAKEMRTKNPESYKTDADALTAYLSTAAGRAEYQSFRDDIVTGANGRLPQMEVKTK